jgi:hypothetical protein
MSNAVSSPRVDTHMDSLPTYVLDEQHPELLPMRTLLHGNGGGLGRIGELGDLLGRLIPPLS